MRAIKILALFCVLSGSSACATVISGRTQEIGVDSIPSGAKVRYQGMTLGKTPCVIELSRGGSEDLKLELDGYEPGLVSLDRRASAAFFGNFPLFLLGIIPGYVGIVIDGVTGSAFEFYPETVKVELKRAKPASEKSPAARQAAAPGGKPAPSPSNSAAKGASPPQVKPPVPGEGQR